MKDPKELIESEKSEEEIVNTLTENVVTINRLKFDLRHWGDVFGAFGNNVDPQEDIDEYNIDMRKVKEAVTAIVRDGKILEGGSPEQKLYSKGSTLVVEVDGYTDTYSFNEQPKFNVHVAWFAADNGDPTRYLKDF